MEERQRIPELLVLREPEPLHDPGGGADEALVRDQAALRVRGRAGRVHQEGNVSHPHRAPPQLELVERDGVARGEEGCAIEVAVG